MTDTSVRMPADDAVAVLHAARRPDEVVVSTMGTARAWMRLGAGPHDLVFVPSAMGHATSIGLGLALAQPARRIIVCNGDGSLLMNLGSLVSITAAAPANLVVVLFDNGAYEVTGAQPTPGTAAGRADGRNVDFAAVARACGVQTVSHFNELRRWREDARQALDLPGPAFVVLDVTAIPGTPGPRSPGPAPARAQQFRRALAGASTPGSAR